MPPHPQLFNSDGVTPATPLSISLNEGDTSATATFWLYNDKGSAIVGTTTLTGARLRLSVVSGGVEISEGLPILDQRMVRATITGMDNAADPTMLLQVSGTIPVGSGADLYLDDIPQGCARQFTLVVIASATTGAQTLRLRIVDGGNSAVIGAHATDGTGSGVLPGYAQNVRQLVRGRNISGASTADVTIERGAFDYDGQRVQRVRSVVTLNQNDVAVAALVATESYIAAISQAANGTVTVTKGAKGVTPVAPVPPAADIPLGTVVVAYQAGGTSIIAPGDVTSIATYGGFLVVAGTGLSAKVYPGEGLGADQFQFSSAAVVVPLTASSTNRVWMTAAGTPQATVTAAPPAVGAYLLAVVTTDPTNVTAVVDARSFIDRPVTLFPVRLAKLGAIAVAADVAWDVVPWPAEIDHIEADVGSAGASSALAWQIDVLTRPAGTPLGTPGTTIYSSFATDDRRPSIAWNAALLRTVTADHEVVDVGEGDRLSADVLTIPTGSGAAADLIITVYLRRK